MHQDQSTCSFQFQMSMNPQFPDHEHLNCPRCHSSNTKFCYYNNYNLSQPRHFCKNCRRYWTKGGTLRNIPIGGGTRKINKRSSTSNKRPANSSSPTSSVTPPPPTPAQPEPEREPEPEPSWIFGFSDNQTKADGGSFSSPLRSNRGGEFGSFFDGLRPNLADGSREDGLIQTPATDVYRSNYLSLNNDHNLSGNGESSGWNEWRNLSIFTPGSN